MGDEQEMYGKDSGSLKSYKTILSPNRGANQQQKVNLRNYTCIKNNNLSWKELNPMPVSKHHEAL